MEEPRFRASKFKLRRVQAPAAPVPQAAISAALAAGAERATAAPPAVANHLTKLGKNKLVRQPAAAASLRPLQQPGLPPSARAPPALLAQLRQQAGGAAAPPARAPVAVAAAAQPPGRSGAKLASPAAAAKPGSKGTVAVLARSADGQQQRVLVYKKGRGGKSLQRTAVKAAARSSLSWRNPALAVASAAPGPAARGQPAAAKPPAAAPGAAGTRGGGGTPQLRRSSKWHKYVRAATPALKAPLMPAQRLAGTSGAQRGSSGDASAAGQLKRLGGSVYKARGGGVPLLLCRRFMRGMPGVLPAWAAGV